MSINFTSVVRAGKDSELRTAGKSQVLGFSAVYNTGFGDHEKSTWIDVSIWGFRATEKMKAAIVKGTQLLVVGELHLDKGEEYTNLRLNAQDIQFVGSKDAAAAPAAAPAAPAADSDVPF